MVHGVQEEGVDGALRGVLAIVDFVVVELCRTSES